MDKAREDDAAGLHAKKKYGKIARPGTNTFTIGGKEVVAWGCQRPGFEGSKLKDSFVENGDQQADVAMNRARKRGEKGLKEEHGERKRGHGEVEVPMDAIFGDMFCVIKVLNRDKADGAENNKREGLS